MGYSNAKDDGMLSFDYNLAPALPPFPLVCTIRPFLVLSAFLPPLGESLIGRCLLHPTFPLLLTLILHWRPFFCTYAQSMLIGCRHACNLPKRGSADLPVCCLLSHENLGKEAVFWSAGRGLLRKGVVHFHARTKTTETTKTTG